MDKKTDLRVNETANAMSVDSSPFQQTANGIPDLWLLKPFPPGPLDRYRNKASFDWRKMLLFLEGEDVLKFKGRVWKTMELDPLFHQPTERISLEKCRELTFLRSKRVLEYEFLTKDEQSDNVMKMSELTVCIGMFDWALSSSIGLHSGIADIAELTIPVAGEDVFY